MINMSSGANKITVLDYRPEARPGGSSSTVGKSKLIACTRSAIRSSKKVVDRQFMNEQIGGYVLQIPEPRPRVAKMRACNDLRRGRTCNLLIRSQTPFHWASRPFSRTTIEWLLLFFLFFFKQYKYWWLLGRLKALKGIQRHQYCTCATNLHGLLVRELWKKSVQFGGRLI